MTKRKSVFFKLTAAFLTFFLIAGDVCKFAEASPAAEPSSSSRVPVPSGKSLRDFFEAPGASLHGTLEETYDGAGGAPFVLILKDAHGSGDAQKSLAGLITRLSAEYDFPLVALEGADGPLDLTLFRAYPEPSQAKALFEDLAGRGEISGAALAAVQAPETTAFYGVEDAALYRQSVQAFLDGLKPSGFEKELAGIQKDLQAEKEKNYGPLLLELDRRREKLRDPANSLEPLFHFFEQLPASFRLRNFSDRYPRLLLVASELEKTGEDRKIQLLTRVFEKRVKRLLAGRGTLREFHALKQKYQTGQMSDAEYAEQLARLDSEKTALPQALAASVQRSRELRALKGEEFWRELNAYLDALMNALAVTEKEKTLRNLSAQARRLEDLIHFRLSRSDWNAVAAWAEPSGISGLAQRVRDFSNETLSDRRPFALFYRLAEKRDGVFAEKIQARMTEARAKAAIFVTGGFHAESLARLLKERGYSYAVVSPAVQEIPDDRVYLDCMRGRVSWSRYFQVRSGALDVYDAFLRAGTERLMRAGHFPAGQKLKSWRDAVLKKLAREGRLDRAASYTAILDAYAAKSSDDPGTRALEQAWMERVAAFVQNLKGLERRGTLTPEKIMGLTSAVSTNHWPAVMSFVPGSRVPAAWLDLERNPVESVRAELRTDEFDFSNLSEVRKKIGDFEIRLKDADAEHLPAVMAELVAFQNDFYAHWKTKDRSRVEGLLEEMSGLHAAARKRLEPLAPAPRFASELVTMRTLDENVLTPPDRYPPDDMDLLLPNEALGSVRQWTAEQLHERDPGAEFHPVTGQVIKGGGFSQIFLMDRVQDGETTRLAVEIPRFADIPPFSFPPAGSPGSLAGTVARNGENFRAFHEAGRTRFVPKPFELLTYPLGRRGRGVGALPVSVHEYFAGTEELSPAFGSLRRWVIDPGTRESRFEALTPAEAGDVLSEIAAIMTYHYDPLKAGGTTISEVRLGNGDVVIPAAGPEGLRRNADGSLGLKLITARDLRTRISIPEFIRSLIQMQANEQMAEDRDKIDPAQSEVIALSLPALFSNPAIAFEGLRRGLYYLALDTEGLAPEAAREKASRTALDWISQFEASSFGKPYAPFIRAWREHGGFSQGTPVFGTDPGEGHPIRGNFTHLRNQLLDSFSADGTPEGISDGPASRSYAFLDRREALIPERPELRSEELSPKDTARLSALLETHESIFGKSADVVALGPARADIGAHVDYPTFPSDGSAQNYSLVFALPFNTLVAGRKKKTGSDVVSLYAADYKKKFEFKISELEAKAKDTAYVEELRRKNPWAGYALGIFYTAKKRGYKLGGAEFTITGDVPKGAGLASSASYMTAMTLAGIRLFGWPLDPAHATWNVAHFAREAEHADYSPFVGAKPGHLDHIASLAAVKDAAVILNYGNLEDLKTLRFDMDGYRLVIVDTTLSHYQADRAEAIFNERVDELNRAVPVMNRLLGLEAAPRLHVSAFTFDEFKSIESRFMAEEPILAKRVRYVLTERERTIKAITALREDRIKDVVPLLDESSQALSMDGDYQLTGTVPGKGRFFDALVEIGREPGIAAGRMIGRGGAGTALFIVRKDRLAEWSEKLVRDFEARMGIKVQVHEVSPSDGARVIWDKNQTKTELRTAEPVRPELRNPFDDLTKPPRPRDLIQQAGVFLSVPSDEKILAWGAAAGLHIKQEIYAEYAHNLNLVLPYLEAMVRYLLRRAKLEPELQFVFMMRDADLMGDAMLSVVRGTPLEGRVIFMPYSKALYVRESHPEERLLAYLGGYVDIPAVFTTSRSSRKRYMFLDIGWIGSAYLHINELFAKYSRAQRTTVPVDAVEGRLIYSSQDLFPEIPFGAALNRHEKTEFHFPPERPVSGVDGIREALAIALQRMPKFTGDYVLRRKGSAWGAVPLVPDKYVLPHVTNIKGHESPVHPLAAVLLQAALVRYFLGRRGALLAENFPEFAPHAELRAEEKPPAPEEAGSAIRFKLWADPRKILYDDARISARDPGVDFLTEDEGEALFAEWKFFDRYDSLKNPGAVWHETGNFMIAYQDGKPVGAYGFVAHPEDNWVRGNGIGVDAAVRRSGIGTRLRERLLGYLKEAGYEFFEIGSTDERFDLRIGADDAAQQFHEDFLRETPAEAIAKVARDRDGKLKGILVDLKHYPAPRGELRAEEEPAAEKPASQVDEAAQAQAAEEMKKVDARPMFGRVSPTVSTDGWYYRWPSFSIPNWTWLRRFIFFRMARAHLYVMAMGVDEQTARRVIESIALVAPLKVRIRRDIWKFEITGWAPYWLRAWASDAEGDPDAAMKIRKYYIALQFLIPGNEQYHRLEQKLDAEYAAGRLADYRAHGIEAPEIRKIEIPYETPIPAYLILPANHEPGKKIPVVQIHHGFTNRKENPYFDSIERGLVQRGIAVLRSDLIGHGGQTLPLISTGKINAYLNAVTRYLEKYPGLDPERIGYFGFSFGGYMGLRALSNVSLGRRLKAVAVENPPVADTFMNYRRVLHHSRDYLEYLFNVTQLADLRLRLRLLSLSRSERRLNVLRERRDRLLVFTSGKDQVITRRDYRWLKNVLGPMLANGRDAVVAYPREDHHIFYERQDMEARVFRHFEQLLLGQEQARPAAKPELRPSALALGREKQLRPRRPELRASLGPESVGPEAEDVFFRSWNMGTEMPKAVADRFRALIPRELLAHLGHPRRKPLKVYTWGTEKEDEAWGLFVQAAGDGEITVRLAQSFGEISDYLFDRENRRLKAEITLIAEGKKLVIGFPGRIEAFPEALQIGPHLSKGEKVFQWWVDNILVPWADKLGFEELEIMQGPLSDDGLWSAGFMPRSRFLRRPARPSDELIWNRRVRPGTKSELRTGQEQPRENFFNRNQAFFRELAIAAAVIAAFGWLSVHYFLPLSREWTQKSPLYFFLFSGVLTLVRAVLAAVIGVRFERKVLNENKPSFERNVRRTVLSLVFNMPVFGFFIFGWLLKMIPGFWVFPAAVVQGVTAQIFLAPFLFDPMNYILGRVFVEKRTFRQAVDDARHNLPGFSFWALVIWLPGHILAFALPDAIGTYIVQGIVTMVWGVVAFILTGRERIEVIAHLREWLKQRFPSLFHPESRIRRLGHFFMRPLLAFYGLSGLGLIAMTTAYGFYVSFLALLGFTIQADVVLSLEILGAGVLFWPAIYVGYRHLMREPAPPPAEGTRAELRTSSPEDFLSAGLKEARPELRTSAPARFYVKPSLALPTRPRGFVSSPPQLTFKFLFSEEKAEFPVLTRQEREALKAAGGWEFLGGVPEIASVNWLIAYEGTRPVGVYAFDAFDSEIVRGKGIYILPEHRRRHIGELLRLYLYDHLKKRGSKYFKVGVTFDHGIGGILKTREAQRFQRSLIAKVAPKAVEGITFYRNSGELQGLTVDLQKFRMPARLPPLRPRTTIYTMRSLSVRKMVMASYRRSELRDLARQVLEVLAAEKALPQPVADRVGKTAAADMDALAQTLAEEAPSLAPRYVSARRNENSLRLIAAGRRLREQHPAWGEDLRVFSRTSAALLGTRYREVLRADPRQKLAFAFAQRLPASVEGRSSFADYLKMIKALQGEFPGRIRAEFRVMASADEIAGEGARDYFRELERTGLVKILNLSSPDAAFLLDEFLRVHGNALVFGLADSALAPGEDLRFVRSDVDAEALLPVAFLLSAHLARDPLSKITAELLKQIPPLLGGLVRYHGRSLEVTPLVLEMAYKFQASELVAQMA